MSDEPQAATVATAQRKAAQRLLPVLFVGYVLAYLDRVNVGFAKLGMQGEPWFSDAVYAAGAGVFFVGYFLFEVPSNLLLARIGARRWIARIMVSWGAISALCATCDSAAAFYALRFLLGVAEAGFFPGIVLYLTQWFPSAQRAQRIALFMTAIAAAGIVGSPLSGWLLEAADGWHGEAAWRWLFVLEGLPSVAFGLCIPWLLPDGPADARWLSPSERALVTAAVAADAAATPPNARALGDVFRSPFVWRCSAVYFGLVVGLYGVSFWLPQRIKDAFAANAATTGWLAAIPWSVGAIAMVAVGRSSDRTGRRRLHVATSAAVGGAALVACAIPGVPAWATLALLSVAAAGMLAAVACSWAAPTAALAGTAAAAGIAWINSCGNLAGYLSPELIAHVKTNHGLPTALAVVGVVLALAGLFAPDAPRR